ncbi:MAG: hypothetical protein V1720_19825 [bacterium]
MSANDKIIEEFEKEMWLYPDGDLSNERTNYWSEQLKSSPFLREMFENSKSALEKYNASLEDIDDSSFQKMINTAARKHSLLKGIRNLSLFKKPDNEKSFTLKIVFSGAVAAASILILLFSNKPNPVKDVGNTLLDWEGSDINRKISSVQTSINILENDRWQEYMKYKIKSDKWKSSIYSIDKEIKALEKEIDEETL